MSVTQLFEVGVIAVSGIAYAIWYLYPSMAPAIEMLRVGLVPGLQPKR